MTTPPIRIGLVGAGIGASLSPALHEQEARALGLEYEYVRYDLDALGIEPAAVGELLDELRDAGLRGVNVTHPCKQLVVEHLDALSDQARALGAVNTVVFEPDALVGHNTDWPGFRAGFSRGLPDAALDDVVLLGAGGAGTAVAHALAELGVGTLHVVDADAERARRLAGALPDRAQAAGVESLPTLLGASRGLVHATPTGMADAPGLPLDPALLHPDLWVADVVYRPLDTALLQAARERGCRTLDGGGMAVFQAVHAFELFAGVEPDAGRMLAHFARLADAEGSAWTRA